MRLKMASGKSHWTRQKMSNLEKYVHTNYTHSKGEGKSRLIEASEPATHYSNLALLCRNTQDKRKQCYPELLFWVYFPVSEIARI